MITNSNYLVHYWINLLSFFFLPLAPTRPHFTLHQLVRHCTAQLSSTTVTWAGRWGVLTKHNSVLVYSAAQRRARAARPVFPTCCFVELFFFPSRHSAKIVP